MAAGNPDIAALQTALAAEHAACYGYGVVGARMAPRSAAQTAAGLDWEDHLRARDQLMTMITRLGGQPVAAAAAYQLPFPVTSPAAAAKLAATLEDGTGGAYLGLVALTDARLRSFGARQLRTAALRAQSWRGTTQSFPGLPAGSLRRTGHRDT